MAEFYFDNLAKNLPDAYKKDSTSNNYKILEVERAANSDLRTMLEQIENILDINNATGATLDMYGKRFGQPRGKATDAQYKAILKSKISRALCRGNYRDIVDAICFTFNCGIDDVRIIETSEPANVLLDKLPLASIINSGFNTTQAQQIIKNLLPVCVTLETVSFDGTFEFGEAENEHDEAAGFGETVEGAIGGYLGWTDAQDPVESLPV